MSATRSQFLLRGQRSYLITLDRAAGALLALGTLCLLWVLGV